jgi:hypothetical protein
MMELSLSVSTDKLLEVFSLFLKLFLKLNEINYLSYLFEDNFVFLRSVGPNQKRIFAKFGSLPVDKIGKNCQFWHFLP